MEIRTATIGQIPDILMMGKVEQMLPSVAAPRSDTPRCSVCMEEQFETPGGVSCPNGHGGAPSA